MHKKRIIFSLFFLVLAAFAYINYPTFFKKTAHQTAETSQVYANQPKVVYSKSSSFGLVEVIETNQPRLFHLCENKDYDLVHSTFSNDDLTLLVNEYEQFATT